MGWWRWRWRWRKRWRWRWWLIMHNHHLRKWADDVDDDGSGWSSGTIIIININFALSPAHEMGWWWRWHWRWWFLTLHNYPGDSDGWLSLLVRVSKRDFHKLKRFQFQKPNSIKIITMWNIERYSRLANGIGWDKRVFSRRWYIQGRKEDLDLQKEKLKESHLLSNIAMEKLRTPYY